ncbi:MAG TPA: Dyp-type peroxidase [Pseudonocardia sp.]
MPDDSVTPQAVLGPLTTSAVFLVVTVDDGGEQAARELLTDLPGLCRAVGFRSMHGELSCVAGIGAAAWPRLFDGPAPAELHPLPVFLGARHRTVSTPGDLLFHLRANRQDLCFELETQIMERLRGSVTVADEVPAFRYFDARDVLGFVDGTENPTGRAASEAVLLDGAGDPAFAGGSYVVVQKYLHDMAAWNALPTEAQELVIGRRKLSDVELGPDEQPEDSHVARATITDPDGTEREILRDNMPFGSPAGDEFGTYFIGYGRTPSVVETMLSSMFVGDPPGSHDRILDFSTPVTGCLFFAPSADFLDDLPPAPPAVSEPVPEAVSDAVSDAAGPSEAAGQEPAPEAPAGASLGIGGLR